MNNSATPNKAVLFYSSGAPITAVLDPPPRRNTLFDKIALGVFRPLYMSLYMPLYTLLYMGPKKCKDVVVRSFYMGLTNGSRHTRVPGTCYLSNADGINRNQAFSRNQSTRGWGSQKHTKHDPNAIMPRSQEAVDQARHRFQ